nr:uncharacterized protein LOC129384344 [Dermacentor andersoni]
MRRKHQHPPSPALHRSTGRPSSPASNLMTCVSWCVQGKAGGQVTCLPGLRRPPARKVTKELHLLSAAARGLTDRAPGKASSPGRPEPICSYNDIGKHNYPSRRLLPLPHSSLCRGMAVTLGLLQTSTYPSPAALHTMYPERFPSPDCPLCGGHADFEHVLWGCASAGPPFAQEETVTLIRAQDQTSQILAIQRARERAVRFHLVVPEWA